MRNTIDPSSRDCPRNDHGEQHNDDGEDSAPTSHDPSV